MNVSDKREPYSFSISDQTMLIFTWISFGVLLQIINIFGIVTNIINIICFANQGFEDSVNISLLGLSVSDLGSLVMMVWTCVSITPAVVAADLPFDSIETSFLITSIPHMSFTRVSSCITALITLERCLCITAPLKIKSIITPKRTTVITICLFIIIFCGGAPVYFVNSLGWKFSPLRNKTIIGVLFTKHREYVEMISFSVNNFSIPFGAFVIIVVCTTILSVKLKRTSKWRKKIINQIQDDRVNNRNQKTAKMVVIVSTLFIVCFVPMSVMMLAVGFVPEMSLQGDFINISTIIAGFGCILESINSSMNIFIYYHMSTKYRESFCKYFFRGLQV